MNSMAGIGPACTGSAAAVSASIASAVRRAQLIIRVSREAMVKDGRGEHGRRRVSPSLQIQRGQNYDGTQHASRTGFFIIGRNSLFASNFCPVPLADRTAGGGSDVKTR